MNSNSRHCGHQALDQDHERGINTRKETMAITNDDKSGIRQVAVRTQIGTVKSGRRICTLLGFVIFKRTASDSDRWVADAFHST